MAVGSGKLQFLFTNGLENNTHILKSHEPSVQTIKSKITTYK